MSQARGVKLGSLLLARQHGRNVNPWLLCQPSCYMGSKSALSPALGHPGDIQLQGILDELKMPFSRAAIGNFFQQMPSLGNQFLEDALLQSYLKRHLPPQVLSEMSQDCKRFAQRLVEEIDSLGRDCELNPPRLQQYDAWGRRVDQIITCSAWKKMKELSAEEGLVAEAYERRYSSWSRLIQVVKLYLYSPSAGLFTCPLAMTDGAAKVIESLGVPEPLQDAYKHLTSRNPSNFWTSGQWMTERRGGSDVAGGTETIAHRQDDGTYRLRGYKWFTSATDSNMSLTLGRVVDNHGNTVLGTKGLSLFYLEVRDAEGNLNGIEVQRLKEKLGTRQVPTAELLLDGVKALKISPEGRGVASISSMLTITRIYNTIFAVAGMRRIINLARDYAAKRFVFGKLIKDHPLHIQTMARMEVEARGAFLIMMEISRLLGLEETNMATEQDQLLLRLLIPVTKLYTGKQALSVISEGLECFGGQGYMEDTGLPVMLRDTQVLTIWEGTTNILSLDVLRSVIKSKGEVLSALFSVTQEKLDAASCVPSLSQAAKHTLRALNKLMAFTQQAGQRGGNYMELAARDFAYSLAKIYIGTLLLDHAAWKGASATDIYCAQRWSDQDLCPVDTAMESGCYDPESVSLDRQLVYDNSPLLKGKL
ncbi:novel acyl-CoA-dehydrogenase protein isoform X1 [Xenopus tropicalis]|uniref:Novel acyl-CoA-dehydrogenase protein n=2 Tax=Xenopus tropicalis TaxID=8364 RepID=F7CJW9_XENTR|nr:novel acyl-CoA-dehydrogenase protein isoform X1 [Xenopus tropicalis]|eukprot:XP_012819170.1 PREDICTED: novel acyl-CoA-dehydrogenase protein isoform X1 [Xenopus tropicalis]